MTHYPPRYVSSVSNTNKSVASDITLTSDNSLAPVKTSA